MRRSVDAHATAGDRGNHESASSTGIGGDAPSASCLRDRVLARHKRPASAGSAIAPAMELANSTEYVALRNPLWQRATHQSSFCGREAIWILNALFFALHLHGTGTGGTLESGRRSRRGRRVPASRYTRPQGGRGRTSHRRQVSSSRRPSLRTHARLRSPVFFVALSESLARGNSATTLLRAVVRRRARESGSRSFRSRGRTRSAATGAATRGVPDSPGE